LLRKLFKQLPELCQCGHRLWYHVDNFCKMPVCYCTKYVKLDNFSYVLWVRSGPKRFLKEIGLFLWYLLFQAFLWFLVVIITIVLIIAFVILSVVDFFMWSFKRELD
jgi:hypothetical protein